VDDDVGVLELFDLEAEPGEEEAVSGASAEAKPSSTVPSLRPLRKRTDISGCSTITPALRRCCCNGGLGDAPRAAGLGHQPAEAVVGLERIASRRDEVQDLLERLFSPA